MERELWDQWDGNRKAGEKAVAFVRARDDVWAEGVVEVEVEKSSQVCIYFEEPAGFLNEV
jgi:hypothetical protein